MFYKVKFKLTKFKQDVLDNIRLIMARDTLLNYLYLMTNLKFTPMILIYNKDWLLPLKVKYIAFYSR